MPKCRAQKRKVRSYLLDAIDVPNSTPDQSPNPIPTQTPLKLVNSPARVNRRERHEKHVAAVVFDAVGACVTVP